MSVIGSSILAGASGAAGGGDKVYVDDVFSTFLYEGSSSTQTITNGIDLAGEGGLVWIKNRDNARDHCLYDSERSLSDRLSSNKSDAAQTLGASGTLTFNSNGVSIPSGDGDLNGSGFGSQVAWNFRKAPGFFDVVTYTGNGTAGRTVAHNLGSVPGMMIIKRTDASNSWNVYHRSLTGTHYLELETSGSAGPNSTIWNNTNPTSTHFTVGSSPTVNNSGGTYVAYLFAHDDAQFGTNSDESIIKCGSYTGTGSTQTIDFGFEPQWVMIKMESRANDGQSGGANGNWIIFDNLRDVSEKSLYANTSAAEANYSGTNYFTSNGITFTNSNDDFNDNYRTPVKYIYMAIRRPNKPPEAGTDVFDDVAYTGTGSANTVSFSPAFADLIWIKNLVYGYPHVLVDRLRGNTKYLSSNSNAIEATLATADSVLLDRQESFKIPGPGYSGGQTNNGNAGYNSYISWVFKRAPGFMDVVAYSGTGSATTINHNLEVVPELMIVKSRSISDHWQVYSSVTDETDFLMLNSTDGTSDQQSKWNDTAPTSSVFTVGSDTGVNQSSATYIAYLFATLSGISKVGSYSGYTSNAVNVDCGFTAGARFILIKRTDSTGDWYVWDTARGIVSGNDPYLLINSNAAEVTNTDYIDPLNSGFTVTASAPAALNATGGTYLFLAIA